MYRLRIKYHKEHHLRFIAHLEMLRLMERVFRRMDLPLHYTQGFNPHPRISFASPLSVGVESVAELLDVELIEKMPVEEVLKRGHNALPRGLTFESAKYVEDKRSLMSLVTWAEYTVFLNCFVEAWRMKEIIAQVMDMDTLMVMKKGGKSDGKTVNIRPQISEINLVENDQGAALKMILANGSGGSLKPELLVQTLANLGNVELCVEKVVRTNLYTTEDDKRIAILDIN